MSLSPEAVLASDDPGDEIARRYRYQWTYAAVVCCMLLDVTQDISDVYCEHHEDIVLRSGNGLVGIQVKTRASNQPVWTTADAAIIHSCARFARMERQFPSAFVAFKFLTNHPLFAGGNGKDFRHILELIKQVDSADKLTGAALKFVNKVSTESSCEKEVVFAALVKTSAGDDLPKLTDMEFRLLSTLSGLWEGANQCSMRAMKQICDALIRECARASSLAHEDDKPAYSAAIMESKEAETKSTIEGKRICRPRLESILAEGLMAESPLYGRPESRPFPGTGTTELLTSKLDAGGFSVVSINSAEDLRDAADYLGICWLQKHGGDRGRQQFGHIRSLVLSDAARAFEAVKNGETKFGVDMLSELRKRFLERRVSQSLLYECTDEHLEGIAYSLTSECKVQWSSDRPWEKKV